MRKWESLLEESGKDDGGNCSNGLMGESNGKRKRGKKLIGWNRVSSWSFLWRLGTADSRSWTITEWVGFCMVPSVPLFPIAFSAGVGGGIDFFSIYKWSRYKDTRPLASLLNGTV